VAERSVRVRCPLGGLAPCFDDLCHGVDTTMCGLEIDFDVCPHGFLPGTCDEPECDLDGEEYVGA
jgi:hypothetical protein